jgi:hypothetical protein
MPPEAVTQVSGHSGKECNAGASETVQRR